MKSLTIGADGATEVIDLPEPTAEEQAAAAAAELADWRVSAFVSRQEFCIALKRAGVLPGAEAVSAAKGDWPATFNAVLPTLAGAGIDADEAQITWASATVIHRNHPMIAALAAAAGLTDAQVDALFGG